MATNKWAATVDRWIESPLAFVREIFGIEPDEWQKEALEAFPHNQYLALQAPLAYDTELWTPAGYRRWGDIQPGDALFAEDGSVTKIVGRYEAGDVPLFKVTLCDGTSIRCTGDHLWKVQTKSDREKNRWQTISTARLAASPLKVTNTVHGRLSRQVTIPTQGPAQFAAASLPLDPYVFGLWLGDGVAGEPTLVCPDQKIRQQVLDRGFIVNPRRASRECISVTLPGTIGRLRATGVHKKRSFEKAIPAMYFKASVQQRLDLLRGLMDSDGTVTRNGQTYLATSSTELAKDFLILARSLGYYATLGGPYKINGGKNRDSYRITVSGSVCPFLADTSKRRRWKAPPPYKSWRFIESIEPDGRGPAMCVEVDHPSHCFQATDFIVTHNCKGPGKTAVLAWLCWNFLVTRPFANIGATSVSGDNLRDNLWKEMLKAMDLNKNGFLRSQFEWTSTKIFRKGHQGRWFMVARTWPKQGNPSSQATTLAGLHEDNIMFVLDESGGIPESVMVTAEAAMSSCVEGHILQAGNPEVSDGPLYRAAKNRKNGLDANGTKQWYVIEITADPDDPNRTPRVDIEYARQQIRNWGRTNPWVMINVLGKFPNGSVSSLISEDEVRAAMQRYYRPYEIGLAARIMGVDVARQGLAMSVISKREGIQMHNFLRYRNLDNNQGGSLTNRIWTEWEADACFIDATGGFGFGWIDNLKLLGKSAIPVQFASNAIQNPERYVNKRAEMYFTFVQWIRDGGALPPEDSEGARELLEALTKTQYFHSRDRLQLEEKEQLTERIGFSPDEADAGALTFAEPVTAKKRVVGRPNQSAVGIYSPFSDMDRNRGGDYSQPGSANGIYNPFTR